MQTYFKFLIVCYHFGQDLLTQCLLGWHSSEIFLILQISLFMLIFLNAFLHFTFNFLFMLTTGSLVFLRYVGRKRKAQMVPVQPPFLRPQLSEAQLAAKVLDNGIHGDLHRVGHLHTCIHTCTHTHTVIFVCICLPICVCPLQLIS